MPLADEYYMQILQVDSWADSEEELVKRLEIVKQLEKTYVPSYESQLWQSKFMVTLVRKGFTVVFREP